jgi:enamine deaminase RidA (YjgF/YER057c/UK114 family)
MSQTVVYGNTLYVAGQAAQNPTSGVAGQTGEVLAEIDGLHALATAQPPHTASPLIAPCR